MSEFIVGEKQSDAAATLAAAVAGTLLIQVISGESPGANFGQSVVTFGGTIALAEATSDLVAPRVVQFSGLKSDMEVMAIRGAVAFGVSYGVFMLAGAPSLYAAAGAAGGVVAGEYIYGMLMSRGSERIYGTDSLSKGKAAPGNASRYSVGPVGI
jgi:hypothetical protein